MLSCLPPLPPPVIPPVPPPVPPYLPKVLRPAKSAGLTAGNTTGTTVGTPPARPSATPPTPPPAIPRVPPPAPLVRPFAFRVSVLILQDFAHHGPDMSVRASYGNRGKRLIPSPRPCPMQFHGPRPRFKRPCSFGGTSTLGSSAQTLGQAQAQLRHFSGTIAPQRSNHGHCGRSSNGGDEGLVFVGALVPGALVVF